MPIIIQIIIAALAGGAVAAIINGFFGLLMFRKKRNAKKADRDDAQSKALKLLLLDKVLYLGQCYIDKGVISLEERRFFHEMHNCYHNDLGGNGDADLIVAAVDRLPLIPKKHHNKGEIQK